MRLTGKNDDEDEDFKIDVLTIEIPEIVCNNVETHAKDYTEDYDNGKLRRKLGEIKLIFKFNCHSYSRKFIKKQNLIEHLKFCSKFYDYHCPYCEYFQTKFSKQILNHVNKYREGYSKYCIVNYENSTNSKSIRHYQYIHSEKSAKCLFCPTSCLDPKRLQYHLKAECRKMFACLGCSKVESSIQGVQSDTL